MENYIKIENQNDLLKHPEYENVYNLLQGVEVVDNFEQAVDHLEGKDKGYVLEVFSVFLCLQNKTPLPISNFDIYVPKKLKDWGTDILLKAQDKVHSIQVKYRSRSNPKATFSLGTGDHNDMGTFMGESIRIFKEFGIPVDELIIWCTRGRAAKQLDGIAHIVANFRFENGRGSFASFIKFVQSNAPEVFKPKVEAIHFTGVAREQDRAITLNLREALVNQEPTNILVSWATGVGKSVQLCSNINEIMHQREKFHIIIAVPRLNLSSQIIDKGLGKFCDLSDVEIINYNSLGNIDSKSLGKVVVCTKNDEHYLDFINKTDRTITIYAYASSGDLKEFVDKHNIKYDVAFYDEYHMSDDNRYSDINIAYTATPNTSGKYFNHKYDINLRVAIENGYIIHPALYNPRYQVRGRTDTDKQLEVIRHIINGPHKKILVTVDRSSQVKQFVEAIGSNEIYACGIASRTEEGNIPFKNDNRGERFRTDQGVLDAFVKADRAILFHHSKVGVGTDIDGLEACVVLRDINSEKELLQLLGRVCRLHPEDRKNFPDRNTTLKSYNQDRLDWDKPYGHFYVPIINDEDLKCQNIFRLLAQSIGLDYVIDFLKNTQSCTNSTNSEKREEITNISEALIREMTGKKLTTVSDYIKAAMNSGDIIDIDFIIDLIILNDLDFDVYEIIYDKAAHIYVESPDLLEMARAKFLETYKRSPSSNQLGQDTLENYLYGLN